MCSHGYYTNFPYSRMSSHESHAPSLPATSSFSLWTLLFFLACNGLHNRLGHLRCKLPTWTQIHSWGPNTFCSLSKHTHVSSSMWWPILLIFSTHNTILLTWLHITTKLHFFLCNIFSYIIHHPSLLQVSPISYLP